MTHAATSLPRRTGVSLVLALLASLLLAVAPSPASHAEDASQVSDADTGSGSRVGPGKVQGAITGAQRGAPRVRMTWFTADWRYLGTRKQLGGVYSVSLPAGGYWLQFTDLRPSYDVTKYAPTDVFVRVRAGDVTIKHVRMQPGAAITGTVLADGRPASKARVVAASTDERSFETRADGRGRFAIGGLPAGSYSVFGYDRAATWVGPSSWVPKLEAGHVVNTSLRMSKRAGSLLVNLLTPRGQLRQSVFVTAVSRRTGQYWVTKARGGTARFTGLAPGRYRMVVPGAGIWLGREGAVEKGRVTPRRPAFGNFRLTRRGGWLTGRVVDELDPTVVMKRAEVRLFDGYGTVLDRTSTDDDGRFTLDGQLTSQQGLTVVVDPLADAGGWMLGKFWCQFESTALDDLAVTTGRQTELGDVVLPHVIDEGTPAHCLVGEAPRRRR
ncbi:MSCRAMM family protein [Nocardioides ferulae]|uniref:MSCRAMM family protein n=1 Tax=Nocardioides ferulae TaxID=2340821 RepID=UPI000EB4FE12|nr:carboxypeptidase-like regulatory domain-containing protein [Nocardioides ferulae]